MAQIMRETFGSGGVGVVLVQLMLIAIVGWLTAYIAEAVGRGQITRMINSLTIVVCIGILATHVWRAADQVVGRWLP